MPKYIKVSNDTLQSWNYKGPSRENGIVRHGVYIQKYRNFIKKSFINNGHIMTSYR